MEPPRGSKKDSHEPAGAASARVRGACCRSTAGSTALEVPDPDSSLLLSRADSVLPASVTSAIPANSHQFRSPQQSPLTVLGPPLLEIPQSQPSAQPSRLSLVATCCEVGFSSPRQGSGGSDSNNSALSPAGDSRGSVLRAPGPCLPGSRKRKRNALS